MYALFTTLTSILAIAEGTFIRKWNLPGCPVPGVSVRKNSIPAGHCLDEGKLRGGSVRIGNLPSNIDISVPYSGRGGGGRNGLTHCASPKITQTRFGDINCYSNTNLGTGTWIHCSRNFGVQQCLNMHSHPKRNWDGSIDLDQYGEQGSQGFVDAEEASLPPTSFHDGSGKQISEEEYNKLAELEQFHISNGSLHLLYPEYYAPDYVLKYDDSLDEWPQESAEDYKREDEHLDAEKRNLPFPTLKKRAHIDTTVYVDTRCRGEILARPQKAGVCHATVNGASINVERLSKNCYVDGYSNDSCAGSASLAVRKGARDGCYDIDTFTSVIVRCD